MKKKNKKLVTKYPFLLPTNVFTREMPKDYDYSYTLLDEMPEAWRKEFGESFCRELKAELEKINALNDFQITQIKEKYGELRIYTNWSTNEIDEIIRKYQDLSMMICINCGKPTKWASLGYISYLCNDCKDVRCRKLTIADIPKREVTVGTSSSVTVASCFEKEMKKQWK